METEQHDYLEGHLLIAMPGMGDPRFERSVIYMCAHSQDGAMGIVINQVSADISFTQLLTQLGVEQEFSSSPRIECPVHRGGPVETGRGFVLHSDDYQAENSTLNMNEGISLTATLDVVRAIASGQGPDKCILALGYSGWGPGQLESEIQANGWLSCQATANLVFDDDIDGKYQQSLAAMGVDLTMLSSEAGRA